MEKQVAVGIDNFKEIIENDCFYIDKTSFIKEWWENKDKVTLITRPRRFGKTLNMSMIDTFFSINYADRGDLFEGLDIWKEEKYRQLQGTYPVIFLSFARVKEDNFQVTKEKMCEILADLYSKHSYLRESDVLTEIDMAFFSRMMSENPRESDLTSSVHRLSDMLYRYYGKKTVIIIDEYDTPMQEAYINGYWDELMSFFRSLFNSTFKTNPYLERGLMTGITRISKESVFSDLNNLKVVTTTSNQYATSFGFTEEEVFNALDEFGIGNEKKQVKEWYDGFVFGSIKDIYNPWSILSFIDNNGVYEAYWANTSGNGLVKKLLREGNSEIKEQLSDLMEGKVLRVPVDEQIVYNQLDESQDAIWSLLLAGGYLTVIEKESEDMTDDEPCYTLKLTNYEIKRMLRKMVREWFGTKKTEYNKFIKAMLNINLKEMNIYMNEISMDIFSYFDTGKRASRLQPERFYHGFVLGLIVDLAKDYVITSNRESGYGRYDIMIEPKNKENMAYIIEFKIHEPDEGEEGLKDTVKSALKQIEEKKYESALIAKGIASDKIVKYGFAFEGKKVLIGVGVV